MDSYRAEATISEGGVLRLSHLPFPAGEKVEVVINPSAHLPVGWPEGFFAETFGAIRDSQFVRHSQGDFEAREPMG